MSSKRGEVGEKWLLCSPKYTYLASLSPRLFPTLRVSLEVFKFLEFFDKYSGTGNGGLLILCVRT